MPGYNFKDLTVSLYDFVWGGLFTWNNSLTICLAHTQFLTTILIIAVFFIMGDDILHLQELVESTEYLKLSNISPPQLHHYLLKDVPPSLRISAALTLCFVSSLEGSVAASHYCPSYHNYQTLVAVVESTEYLNLSNIRFSYCLSSFPFLSQLSDPCCCCSSLLLGSSESFCGVILVLLIVLSSMLPPSLHIFMISFYS